MGQFKIDNCSVNPKEEVSIQAKMKDIEIQINNIETKIGQLLGVNWTTEQLINSNGNERDRILNSIQDPIKRGTLVLLIGQLKANRDALDSYKSSIQNTREELKSCNNSNNYHRTLDLVGKHYGYLIEKLINNKELGNLFLIEKDVGEGGTSRYYREGGSFNFKKDTTGYTFDLDDFYRDMWSVSIVFPTDTKAKNHGLYVEGCVFSFLSPEMEKPLNTPGLQEFLKLTPEDIIKKAMLVNKSFLKARKDNEKYIQQIKNLIATFESDDIDLEFNEQEDYMSPSFWGIEIFGGRGVNKQSLTYFTAPHYEVDSQTGKINLVHEENKLTVEYINEIIKKLRKNGKLR